MHMVRHDYVAAYGSAMALTRGAPFLNQNLSDLTSRQHRSTIFRAHRDEINRRIHPDSIESPQMLMHRPFVADVADVGESNVLPRSREPRSERGGYSGLQRCAAKNFIRIIRVIRVIRGSVK